MPIIAYIPTIKSSNCPLPPPINIENIATMPKTIEILIFVAFDFSSANIFLSSVSNSFNMFVLFAK